MIWKSIHRYSIDTGACASTRAVPGASSANKKMKVMTQKRKKSNQMPINWIIWTWNKTKKDKKIKYLIK